MTTQRILDAIRKNAPFVIEAGESYTFVNESDRRMHAMLRTADSAAIAVDVDPGCTFDARSGVSALEITLIALRRK